MNGHENDANGATPSADDGASGGGIFSTPDLTIESENIPANVGGAPVIDETAGTPSSDNSSRIASAFANTDATSQLQDVNAIMQSRSNMTTSTATGDIKLAPSTKPKSKAPLIIIVLLVLAGVGALVWATVTGRLSFGDDGSNAVSVIEESVTPAKEFEEVIVAAYYNRLNTEQLFIEGTSNVLNKSIPQLKKLQEALDKTSNSKYDSLKKTLADLVPAYEQTLTLYNTLRTAINDGDTEKLAELIVSDNDTVASIANAVSEFIIEEQRLGEVITAHNCDTAQDNAACGVMYENYGAYVAEFMQNKVLPRRIMKAYADTIYDPSLPLGTQLEEIAQ